MTKHDEPLSWADDAGSFIFDGADDFDTDPIELAKNGDSVASCRNRNLADMYGEGHVCLVINLPVMGNRAYQEIICASDSFWRHKHLEHNPKAAAGRVKIADIGFRRHGDLVFDRAGNLPERPQRIIPSFVS